MNYRVQNNEPSHEEWLMVYADQLALAKPIAARVLKLTLTACSSDSIAFVQRASFTGEDVFGGFGSSKGLWFRVVLPEIVVNGKAKVSQRAAQNVATLGLV